MKSRPLSVTLIGYLFILAGTAGIIYHASELKNIFGNAEVPVVLLIRLLAIVGGVFTLRGANWSRWALLTWIVYHAILSFSHSTSEMTMHVAISVITFVSLFHTSANIYFKKK